jgi:hypothetical protein
LSSHTDRVKLGLSTHEKETNPYPLKTTKTFSDRKANHLYNSKGVMTGLGQGSDAAYFEKGNMAKEGFGGVPKDVVNTKRFFFESVNPMNP